MILPHLVPVADFTRIGLRKAPGASQEAVDGVSAFGTAAAGLRYDRCGWAFLCGWQQADLR